MKCIYVMKCCSKCNEIKYIGRFSKQKTGKYGVRAMCNECRSKYYKENKKRDLENSRAWYENNKNRKSNTSKIYYQNNRESLLKQQEDYRENNKDKIKEYHKEYYIENKEYINKQHKDYYKENKHTFFNASNRRRDKLGNQGKGITKEQWLEMMKFFDWKCAYSGETLTDSNRTIDHIVSLNKYGENEPWNCVPMIRNYNSSKKDKYMLDWYIDQSFFDVERLTKIYEWRIYAYEKWCNK